MEKPYPVHTYDYNEEGVLPPYCNNCGYGYIEYIPIPKKLITKISNHSIKEILSVLCNGGRYFSYEYKKILYKQLKDKQFSTYPLAKEIISKANKEGFQLDWNFVINTIYMKLSFSS